MNFQFHPMRTTRRAFVLSLAALALSATIPQSSTASERHYTIAIATLMQHPALDAVQSGIRQELARLGFVEGRNTTYLLENADGQVQLAAGIANDLASRKPGVIVAITTPMAQAVVKVAKVPVVFAAVTDPVGAGIVKSLTRGEGMVTGTSDAWPYNDQLKLIHEITPKARRLGVLYNPGEAASQYGIKQIRHFAASYGYTLVEGPVSTSNDVYPVARGLVGRVDALFLSSDNTVIAGMAGALQVARQNHIPLYVGDSGTVEKGGLAAVSVGYHELGIETGKLVARVLAGQRNIPTVVAHGDEIYVNTKAAQMMGVNIPASVLKRATKVYDTIQ